MESHKNYVKLYFVKAPCFIIVRSQICNCLPLKDISFNVKCLLGRCDEPEVTCLVRVIFGINHRRDF